MIAEADEVLRVRVALVSGLAPPLYGRSLVVVVTREAHCKLLLRQTVRGIGPGPFFFLMSPFFFLDLDDTCSLKKNKSFMLPKRASTPCARALELGSTRIQLPPPKKGKCRNVLCSRNEDFFSSALHGPLHNACNERPFVDEQRAHWCHRAPPVTAQKIFVWGA